jgi:hypothetical protein
MAWQQYAERDDALDLPVRPPGHAIRDTKKPHPPDATFS